MQSTDLIKLLNRVEAEFPVNQWRIADMYVWPIVRFNIFAANADEINKGHIDLSGKLTRKLKRRFQSIANYLRYLRATILDRKHNTSADYVVDVVALSDGVSFLKLAEGWFEKFCDPFIEHFSTLNRKNFPHDAFA